MLRKLKCSEDNSGRAPSRCSSDLLEPRAGALAFSLLFAGSGDASFMVIHLVSVRVYRIQLEKALVL